MKYLKIKDKKMMPLSFLQILCVGMMFGVIFFILSKNHFLQNTNYWLDEMVQYSKYIDINKQEYFFYLLKQRIKNIFSVIICTIIWNYHVASRIITLIIGFVMGVLLSICMRRWGPVGILLWFFFHMPQNLFYFAALALWGRLQKVTQDMSSDIFHSGFNKRIPGKKMLQYMLIIIVAILGIVVEYYVNILLLQKILIIFGNLGYNI